MDEIKEEIEKDPSQLVNILIKYRRLISTYTLNAYYGCELFTKYYKEIYNHAMWFVNIQQQNTFYMIHCTTEELYIFMTDGDIYYTLQNINSSIETIMRLRLYEKYAKIVDYMIQNQHDIQIYGVLSIAVKILNEILEYNLDNYIDEFNLLVNTKLYYQFTFTIKHLYNYINIEYNQIIILSYPINDNKYYNMINTLSYLDPKKFNIIFKTYHKSKFYRILDKDLAIRLARNRPIYNKYSLVHLGIPRHLFKDHTTCKYFLELDSVNTEIRKMLDLVFIPEISQMIQSFVIV